MRLPGAGAFPPLQDRQHGWSVVTALVRAMWAAVQDLLCTPSGAVFHTTQLAQDLPVKGAVRLSADIQRQFIHVVPNSSIASKTKPFLEGPTKWSERIAKLRKQSVQLAKVSQLKETNWTFHGVSQLSYPLSEKMMRGRNSSEFHRWPWVW